MWQMSMKLPAMFDQNHPHTFDKMAKKPHNYKKRSQMNYVDPHPTGGGGST